LAILSDCIEYDFIEYYIGEENTIRVLYAFADRLYTTKVSFIRLTPKINKKPAANFMLFIKHCCHYLSKTPKTLEIQGFSDKMWWRRGESNPCPKPYPQELLRVQPLF